MSSHAPKISVTLLTMSWSRVFIPAVSAAALLALPLAAAQETYTVQPGDTLTAVAGRYGTTVEALLAANMLTGTDLLAGATLIIPESNTYTVEPGDSLSAIAQETGVAVEELMALNSLSDTSLVIGQKLVLSGPTPTVTQAVTQAVPLNVTVEPGDSLWSLSERYGVPVGALSSANGLRSDEMLTVGETLTIPSVQADAAPGDLGGGAEPSITIESGDSLSSIALRHGTSVEALKELNGLDGDTLSAGATLRLPPASSRAATTHIIWPLSGEITSYFGPRALLGMTYHYGIDIDGDTGDPIIAAMPGTVTYSGWQGGYGYLTVIESGGVEYYYGHASELLTQVGQQVTAGDVIAKVGSTGRSTGSHLHFEIRINGQAVDPLPYLERTASLP